MQKNTKPQLLPSTTVTVLTATSCNTVKTYIDTEGQLKCQQYGNERYFNHKCVSIHGVEQLSTLLTDLSKQKNAILVRGTPIPGLPKLTDRTKDKFPEAQDGCYWVMLDFDNLPVPEGMKPNSTKAIEYIVQKLPTEFHDISYFFQFSSSAGILTPSGEPLKSGINVHIFFWFKRPIHGKPLSAYFESHCYQTGFFTKTFDRSEMPVIKTGVDLSVIRSSVQPHYIGLPIIGRGVTCTLLPTERQGLVTKRKNSVDLPEMPSTLMSGVISIRKQLRTEWKIECGFVSTRMITRAAHGGISVSSYFRNPNSTSPSTNRVFIEAKPYGENAIILYFDGEVSPGSFFVKQTSPQLAIRFGCFDSIPLKELSDGAYAYVRDNLKWFTEISHIELLLTEAGYIPDILSFLTAKYALVLAPTGSGKTTKFCQHARSKNVVIIYAAQTIALVDQMYAELTKNGLYRSTSKNWLFNVPWAVRYTDFFTGNRLKEGVVYVTTNESLYKFIDAAQEQGIEYELVVDEIHVALDDFMATNKKNELFEKAIARASRAIFMTGTITNLQIGKLMDTISRACGALTPEVYSSYQFLPVKSNPLYLADISRFGADFVALLRQYQVLKNAGLPIPRTVIIAPSTKMRIFEMLLEHYGLLADSCVVSRQESLQDDIEIARTSTLPILISSPLFALGLNFEVQPARFWTYFSHLQVDQSQIIQTLNRANRSSIVPCEVRLYYGELDSEPVTIPKVELKWIQIEGYLLDEASVQGLLDAHYHIDRATYLSMREAEKKTAKSLHALISGDGFQNYRIEEDWIDTLVGTKEDKTQFDAFKKAAAESYLDDIAIHAGHHGGYPDILLLHFLEKLYQEKSDLCANNQNVAREFENKERGICMLMCNVSAKDSASVKPARIRRLFGELNPYMTAQFSHEKTGEWRTVAAEKTLALIPLLRHLKKMRAGQMNGLQFAFQMKRPSLREAVKALADNENNYIAWQEKLTRLDTISDQNRNHASDNKKVELKQEQFEIAQDFLKTIGVTFGKTKINGKDVTDHNKPLVPDWDFDKMIAVLFRKAESLKCLPEEPVNKDLVELRWVGANVSLALCEQCVHCSRDNFCALGRPIQPFWDDIEAVSHKCDQYRKIPARLAA